LTGQYTIEGAYHNINLGSLLLNVTSYHILLPDENYSNTSIAPTYESNMTLFTSIKSSAESWSRDQIDDSIFGESIKYLIKIGVIELPYQSQSTTNQLI